MINERTDYSPLHLVFIVFFTFTHTLTTENKLLGAICLGKVHIHFYFLTISF